MSLVYFIQRDNGPIKIGFTKSLSDRIANLQCGSPVGLNVLATVAGNRKAERYFHKLFAAHRVTGEWFSNVAEVLEMIDAIKLSGSDVLPEECRAIEVDDATDKEMQKQIANLCRDYVMGIVEPLNSPDRIPRPELLELVSKCARISYSAVKSVYYGESPKITAHTFLSLRAAFVAKHIGKSSLFETDIAIMREAARKITAGEKVLS